MEGTNTNAEVNSSDMRKFLCVVNEAELNQPDPKYVEYAQLMAKYDMLTKEMAPDTSGLGVEKGASPDAVASINAIKTKAEQLAGPNLQAWEQARQKENTASMAQANANLPAMAAQLEEVGMSRLLSIITEGKGPLNRSTSAESITMQHYTTPVQNVIENASPSIIDKYFKAVEQELKESAQRGNIQSRQLAERVTTRLNELSTATLASYKKKAGADASKADKEGDFKRGNKRFSGIVKATKKQFANDTKQGVAEGSEWETRHDEFTTVGDRATPEQINKIVKALIGAAQQAGSKRGFLNQLVGKQSNGDLARMAHVAETLAKNIQKNSNAKPGSDERKELGQHLVYAVSLLKRISGKQGVAEGNDPNELTASVTVDGEFKEFDLTPFIAKNNWVGTPQQVIKLAEKWLSDFLRKKGLAYSNLKITYKGMTLNANQIGDVGSSEFESVAEGERTMSRAAKGYEKYGKAGMTALAKAGREGKDLDKIRDKYNKYDEAANPAQQAAIAIAKKKAGKK